MERNEWMTSALSLQFYDILFTNDACRFSLQGVNGFFFVADLGSRASSMNEILCFSVALFTMFFAVLNAWQKYSQRSFFLMTLIVLNASWFIMTRRSFSLEFDAFVCLLSCCRCFIFGTSHWNIKFWQYPASSLRRNRLLMTLNERTCFHALAFDSIIFWLIFGRSLTAYDL